MKRLVNTLIKSLPNLVNVAVFLFFIFTIFGIMGQQLWSSKFYNRCRLTESPLPNSTYWPKSELYTRVCSNEEWGYKCEGGTFCGNPIDFGISLADDGVYSDSYIQFALPSFDNFFKSFIAQFQMLTLDTWSLVMANVSFGEN